MRKLEDVIEEALSVEPGTITPDSSPETVPAWDSMGLVKIVSAVEQAYGLRLSADEIIEFASVAGVRAVLAQHNIS